MKITIIRPDGRVVVDGKGHDIDCRGLPAYIRAVQYDDQRKQGHIEFIVDADGRGMPNQPITDFSAFATIVQDWQAAEDAEHKRTKALASARDDASREAEHLANQQ